MGNSIKKVKIFILFSFITSLVVSKPLVVSSTHSELTSISTLIGADDSKSAKEINTLQTTIASRSTIILNGGTTPTIAYRSFQAANTLTTSNAVSLGSFTIRDGDGTNNDNDGTPTILSNITFSLTNSSNVKAIAIFDSRNVNVGEIYNPGNTVTFTSLNLTANQNSSTNFSIYVTFNSSVVDGTNIDLTVLGVTTPLNNTSSGFIGGNAGGATTNGLNHNKIDVEGTKISVDPATLSPAPSGANFAASPYTNGITVKALDNNNNVDTDATNEIIISLQSLPNQSTNANINGSQEVRESLVRGQIIFTDLKINTNTTGNYTIRFRNGGGGRTTLSLQDITINITIPQEVSITPSNTTTMCFDGNYQSISAITIAERNPSDFSSGGTFILSLPTGFEFNTTASVTPTISGNEINSISRVSYPSARELSFSYQISGTTHSTLDQIVISGLEVKYVLYSPATGNITRTGGTAVQAGNSTTDNKNHGTLISLNNTGITPPVITVESMNGQAAIDPNSTSFSESLSSVKLIGAPSGGVFSGLGVVRNATGIYLFSPLIVGNGTTQVTYTVTTNTQNCKVQASKQFSVSSTAIIGLKSSYCSNDLGRSQLSLSITSTHDFVYLASSTETQTATEFIVKEIYNLLGTQIQAMSITKTYDLPRTVAQVPKSTSIVHITPVGQTGTATHQFDPSWRFPDNQNIIIYPRVIISPGVYELGNRAETKIISAPQVPDVGLSGNSFCSSETTAIQLDGRPSPNSATDRYSTNPPGLGLSNVRNAWTFTPSSVPASQHDIPFTLAYTYTDPATNCSNFSVKIITVYGTPPKLSLGEINSPPVCQNTPPDSLRINSPAPGMTYIWYATNGTTEIGRGSKLALGSLPTTIFNNRVLGSYTFYVTQTKNTCESSRTEVLANVITRPTLSLSSSTTICNGDRVNISQSSVSASLGGGATNATWSGGGVGGYENGRKDIIGNNASTFYTPSAAESSAGSVVLTLTTDRPNAACPAAVATFTITINRKPGLPKFFKLGNALADNATIEYCDNDLSDPAVDKKIYAAGDGTDLIHFYKELANGQRSVLSTDLPDNLISPPSYSYTYNQNERNITFVATQTIGKTPTFAGCTSNEARLKVLLHPQPVPSYTVSQLCKEDSTLFTLPNPLPLPTGPQGVTYTYSNWEWDFGDGNKLFRSSNVKNKYRDIGNYSTALKFTSRASTGFACSSKSDPKIVEIGNKPDIDFNVSSQCLGDNTKFTPSIGSSLVNTPNGRTIKTWIWDFGTSNAGISTSTLQAPSFIYPKPGIYNVKLTATSKLDCTEEKIKSIYILPTISVAENNLYSEGFENNNNVLNNNTPSNFGGWATEAFGASASSWNLKQPQAGVNIKIHSASQGNLIWVAGLSGASNSYLQNEKSVLNSPCFNISQLSSPVLSFDYFRDTWEKNDGAYLQYSNDNGSSWKTLGTIGTGIGWYSNSFIEGLSGSGNLGQQTGQEGWDGLSKSGSGWETAHYPLDKFDNTPLANPSNTRNNLVRLRFYFGSQPVKDPSNNTHNGFAIDRFSIKNSNRIVLAESFTNLSVAGAVSYINDFKNFKQFNNSLLKIQYHTNFGGKNDPYYTYNTIDPMARAAFYGITNIFYGQNSRLGMKGFIDGFDGGTSNSSSKINFEGYIYSATNSNADNYFTNRSLVPSPLNIQLSSPTINADSIVWSVNINVLNGNSLSTKDRQYIVFMAVVENLGGQNILRNLIPNAGGIPLKVFDPGTTQTLKYSYQVSAPLNPGNLSAICFVQEITTKDILQASSSLLPTASVITNTTPSLEPSVLLYPIPTNRELIVSLPQSTDVNSLLRIFDNMGKPVYHAAIEKGRQSITIDTESLAAGIYILQLETKTRISRTKFIVIR